MKIFKLAHDQNLNLNSNQIRTQIRTRTCLQTCVQTWTHIRTWIRTMTPEWLSWFEITGFVSFVCYGIYNRVLTYRAVEQRTLKLEIAFEQYQKDIAHYLQICELCRGEVRHHHEDEIERHVTPSMKDQIHLLVVDVAEIKKYLLEHRL